MSALAALALGACNDAATSATTSASTSGYGSSASSSSLPLIPPLDASIQANKGGASLTDTLEDVSAAATAGVLELHAFHHGGLTHLVSLAMDTLGLPPERQAAVLALQRDLDASAAPARVAERQLLLALAEGVAAGKTDDKAVNEALTRLAAAFTSRAASADALNKLHALLTPVEREVLADKVVAHADLAREANDVGGVSGGRIARLTTALGLSAAQVTQVRAELRVGVPANESEEKLGKEFDGRVRTFATAFAEGPFDAKTLSTGDGTDNGLASMRAMHMAHFYEVLTPLLTQPQRTELASRLRDRADDTDTAPFK